MPFSRAINRIPRTLRQREYRSAAVSMYKIPNKQTQIYNKLIFFGKGDGTMITAIFAKINGTVIINCGNILFCPSITDCHNKRMSI